MRNTNVIMSDAINCLLDHLGVVETEIFISNLIREPFDYTQWRIDRFEELPLDKLNDKAAEYSRKYHR